MRKAGYGDATLEDSARGFVGGWAWCVVHLQGHVRQRVPVDIHPRTSRARALRIEIHDLVRLQEPAQPARLASQGILESPESKGRRPDRPAASGGYHSSPSWTDPGLVDD